MIDKKFNIQKSSGDSVAFDKNKLENSLKRSGADEDTIQIVINKISSYLYDGISTDEVYKIAFKLLLKERISSAARYSLKKAIIDLGPSGFPFEKFIGELLKQQDYQTKVGQIVDGYCIQHEVDVIATKKNIQYLIECKFHNDNSKQVNVQVPLYIHSRVNDIIRKRSAMKEYEGYDFRACIVTNTRFTLDAINYGVCSDLLLLSWNYPNGNSLRELIEKYKFYPITMLASINKTQKSILIQNNVLLCKQLYDDKNLIDILNLKGHKLLNIKNEINDLFAK